MIEKERIGTYIGKGLQHSVYEYGSDWVIKIPHLWMRLSTSPMYKNQELSLAKKYLGNFLPETHIEPFRGSYCYIQKRIRGLTALTLSHVDSHRSYIDEFLATNERLVREHRLSADVLGGEAYAHALTRHAHDMPILSANVVIDEPTNRLYLLDTDLLRTSPFNVSMPREIIFVIVSFLGYHLNRFTLRHYGLR